MVTKFEDLKQQQPTKALVIRKRRIMPITVGDLRKICNENPSHPLSEQKLKSVVFAKDNTDLIVYCEEEDIRSLCGDGDTKMLHSIEDGHRTIQKSLVPKNKPSVNPPKPEAIPVISSQKKD